MSKVSERLVWLEGDRVRVRLSYADSGQVSIEDFEATYREVIPLGRVYFFVFIVDGVRRMIRTENVVEMIQLTGNE